MKTFLAVLFVLFIMLFGCLQCGSDVHLTKKDIGCQTVTNLNAPFCCGKFFTGKGSNGSKDAICRPLIDELRDFFREERSKRRFVFCESQADKQKCFDKMNSK